MDLHSYPVTETKRSRVETESWPDFNCLLKSLDKNITCLEIQRVANGHKALIRFKNSYGLEIFKYPKGDCFEMSVIRFTGGGISTYDFAFSTPIPDLSIGYADDDIYRLCVKVSELR